MAERPREKLGRTMAYEYDQLLPAQRVALGALPMTVQLDGEDILAVHGTPTEDETFLLEDRIESRMYLSRPREIKARLGDVKASLVLCGHSHTQQVVHPWWTIDRQPRERWLSGLRRRTGRGRHKCPVAARALRTADPR